MFVLQHVCAKYPLMWWLVAYSWLVWTQSKWWGPIWSAYVRAEEVLYSTVSTVAHILDWRVHTHTGITVELHCCSMVNLQQDGVCLHVCVHSYRLTNTKLGSRVSVLLHTSMKSSRKEPVYMKLFAAKVVSWCCHDSTETKCQAMHTPVLQFQGGDS